MPLQKTPVNDDEFTMWRAIFAFALADGKLSLEEQGILTHHLKEENFSEEQMRTLRTDMSKFQSVEDLFSNIISQKNKKKFCAIARTLVWCDGDIDLQEKKILQNVSCFKKPDAAEILKNSVKHKIYKNFADVYDQVSQYGNDDHHPLFASVA